MLAEQTLRTMGELKLWGMVKAFENALKRPKKAQLNHAEFVGLLMQAEKMDRENRRLQRLLKKARLRMPACLEDMDFRHPRGLKKQAILDLNDGQWIQAHRNVLLTGPTGIGKTWIACALGNQAARLGYTTLYFRAPRLFEELKLARADGSHLRFLKRLAKVQVLILDDFLLTRLADQPRQDFLEIIEDRYKIGSTVLTSQCPTVDWHPHMGDPNLADAICDRLFEQAFKIPLKGKSFRADE